MRLLHDSTRHHCASAIAATFAVIAGGGTVLADTICVPGDHETIQEALVAAENGDEICVEPGTYGEVIDFGGKRIRLYSTGGPEVTTIDATGLDTTVVTCTGAEDLTTVLEGFTIKGGVAPDQIAGGGMYVSEAAATIIDCVFTGNTARHGGGVHVEFGDARLVRCTFSSNTADYAGGLRVSNGSATVLHCTFTANAATHGGAVQMADADASIIGCVMRGNSAEQAGGGILNFESAPLIANCVFTGNSAPWGAAVECTTNSPARMINCSMIANDGRAITNYESDTFITNCIVWGNSLEQIQSTSSTPTVMYCDIEGGYAGVTNIDADPLCVDPLNGDVRLSPASPCIDAGANNAVGADAVDLDQDADLVERLPLDADENPRFADDPQTDDTGCGSPVVVDIGAYEFAGDTVEPLLVGDVDGNGVVDFADVLPLLVAWGECDTDCCLADVDFNGVVDFADVLAILLTWAHSG